MSGLFASYDLGTTAFTPSAHIKRRVEEKPIVDYIRVDVVNQTGACGVGNAYGFIKTNTGDYPYGRPLSEDRMKAAAGGCGWISIAFIDTEVCKETYKWFKDHFPCVYQSPIRFNTNSDNNFFFCIFDTGVKGTYEERADDQDEDFDEDHNPGFLNGLDW